MVAGNEKSNLEMSAGAGHKSPHAFDPLAPGGTYSLDLSDEHRHYVCCASLPLCLQSYELLALVEFKL